MPLMLESMVAERPGARAVAESLHFIHKMEAEKEGRKEREGEGKILGPAQENLKSSSPVTHASKQATPLNSSQKHFYQLGNKAFKYLRLWGWTILIQTTSRTEGICGWRVVLPHCSR